MEDLIKTLKKFDRDQVLGALGLERRSAREDQILPALGIFTAGLLLGAGMGLLAAPRTGRTLRRQLKRGATDVVERATETVEELRGSRG